MALAMNISITELQVEVNKRLYKVQCDSDAVDVTVTDNPNEVASWILTTRSAIHNVRPDRLVVGVRVEWRRSLRSGLWRGLHHPVDILQLCVGKNCLIFQIGHANGIIPEQLVDFLGDNRFTFVGVGIRTDVEILNRDYGIHFGQYIVDLSELFTMQRENDCGLFCKNYGLRQLNNLVLDRDYVRPITITMSRWDALLLHHDQILYACVDVYVCYKIGQFLQAWGI